MANEDGMNAESRITGWLYAFDANNEPDDPDRLIEVAFEQTEDGDVRNFVHAGDLIKRHSESRESLLDDVELLGRFLAGYDDENAMGTTYSRYAFSRAAQLPGNAMPIACFVTDYGTDGDDTTIRRRCRINGQLQHAALVGVQRLAADMAGYLPELFDRFDEEVGNAVSGRSDTVDLSETEPDDNAPESDDETAVAGTGGESHVMGYFCAYGRGADVDDSDTIADICIGGVGDDGRIAVDCALPLDNAGECSALLMFASQLRDELRTFVAQLPDASEHHERLCYCYSFTKTSEPLENTLSLGRIIGEFENGVPVGSHCELNGDERLHDVLIGASHVIEEAFPYICQAYNQVVGVQR